MFVCVCGEEGGGGGGGKRYKEKRERTHNFITQ